VDFVLVLAFESDVTVDEAATVATSSDSDDVSASTSDTAADDNTPSDATTNLTDDVSTTTPVEAPPEGLTEVHIIGTKYIDYFTDGTTTVSFPGDPDIDSHFSEPDAPIPTHEGLTWVNTTGQPLYDTASGDLEVGQYAVQSKGSYIQKNFPFVSSTSTPDTIEAASTEGTTTEQSASGGTDTSVTEDGTASTFSDTAAPPPPVDDPASALDNSTSSVERP
jgi:hypothetical protein